MNPIRKIFCLASALLVGMSGVVTAQAAPQTNIFSTNLWWFGAANPNPVPSSPFQFTPLSLVPDFLKPTYSWFNGINFDVEFLRPNVRIGPYGEAFFGSLSTNEEGQAALAVYSGTLTLNFPNGEKLEIKTGQATILDKDNPSQSKVQSIASLMDNPAYREMLMQAVTSTAAQLANATDENRAELSRGLAAIIQTLSAADPAAAQSIVEAAVNVLTEGGKDDANTINAVALVLAAAENGSNQPAGTFTSYAVAAANKNGANAITDSALTSVTAQQSLAQVFTGGTEAQSLDITIVSPSS